MSCLREAFKWSRSSSFKSTSDWLTDMMEVEIDSQEWNNSYLPDIQVSLLRCSASGSTRALYTHINIHPVKSSYYAATWAPVLSNIFQTMHKCIKSCHSDSKFEANIPPPPGPPTFNLRKTAILVVKGRGWPGLREEFKSTGWVILHERNWFWSHLLYPDSFGWDQYRVEEME